MKTYSAICPLKLGNFPSLRILYLSYAVEVSRFNGEMNHCIPFLRKKRVKFSLKVPDVEGCGLPYEEGPLRLELVCRCASPNPLFVAF